RGFIVVMVHINNRAVETECSHHVHARFHRSTLLLLLLHRFAAAANHHEEQQAQYCQHDEHKHAGAALFTAPSLRNNRGYFGIISHKRLPTILSLYSDTGQRPRENGPEVRQSAYNVSAYPHAHTQIA